MLLKRAQACGASAWTVLILVSWASACIFSSLTLLGGTMQSPWLLWQPAIVGVLFMAGQFFVFLAVKLGDVSIAGPVLGIKVLLVPAISIVLVDEAMTVRVWLAALIAMVGIVFVQANDKNVPRSRILWSVVLSLLAALSMSIFDLLIQRWAPAWGAGYFLPIMFASTALLSLALLPLADRPSKLADWGISLPLIAGAILIAVQAIGMTYTLAQFGDATRVNIVYSLRGVWGVILAWLFSATLQAAPENQNTRVMSMRLAGALLIGVSVCISVA